MTVKEMHYDFKQKLNKIDSNKNRNLYVPEIDWKLNEAQELFVKIIAQPRVRKELGFEINQRTIDDIRTIVVDQKPSEGIEAKAYDNMSFLAEIPKDYWFYINSRVYATKTECKATRLSTQVIQHDDEDDLSPFDRSSFEWRIANLKFNSKGIRIFTDTTFVIDKICLSYIRKLNLIHNAQDFQGGTYNTLSGKTLTGTSDCELPEGVHREIVDLAVLITANDIGLPDYQLKQNKVSLAQG